VQILELLEIKVIQRCEFHGCLFSIMHDNCPDDYPHLSAFSANVLENLPSENAGSLLTTNSSRKAVIAVRVRRKSILFRRNIYTRRFE
jgi:hypothetical protein